MSEPYTEAQYQGLVAVLGALVERYESLSVDNVVGHRDIAPGRKEDPGTGFDWARVLKALHRP